MAEGMMIIGGSSSGKSQYAEELAEAMGRELGFPVYYLATARVIDEEFAERVERHRHRRPAAWETIEEPLNLAGALRGLGPKGVICLVDGVSTWMSNLLIENPGDQRVGDAEKEKRCLDQVHDFIAAWRSVDGLVIMVADEVGWDLQPEYELGRIFVNLNGRANQLLARHAREVIFIASGMPICMKGGING